MQRHASLWTFGLALMLFGLTGCPDDENNANSEPTEQCMSTADCRPNQMCSANNVCVARPPGSCESDANCDFDQYCGADMVCKPSACQDDSGCDEGAICDDARMTCRSGCRENADCSVAGEVCNGSTNECELAGCLSTGCQDGIEVCDESGDLPRCIPTGACTNPGQCAIYADFVDDGEEYVCDTGQKLCVVKPPCAGDEDCRSGDICEERAGERNRCRTGCREDDNCSVGEFCDEDGSFTPPGAEYDALVCIRGCITDVDCNALLNDPTGQYACQELKCIPKCQGLDDCEDGQICTGQPRTCQGCTGDNQCPSTQFCDFSLGFSDEDREDMELGLCTDLPPDCPADGYESNHQLADAFRIDSFPFVADGTMTTPDMTPINQPFFCQENTAGEWFVVQAESGQVITARIEYDTSGANLDLALKRSTNEDIIVSALPPTTDGGDEEIVYGVLNTDTFFLQVRGSIVDKKIPYKLFVDVAEPPPCRDDALEENDTPSAAKPLDAGTDYMNLQVCGSDKDFYQLDVLPDQVVEVELFAPVELGDLDIYATSPDGSAIVPAVGGENTLYFESNAGGLYTIEVVVAEGVGNIDYDIRWSQIPNQCTDSLESNDLNDPTVAPNDVCASATDLVTPAGQTTSYTDLNVCPDTDWYKISLLPLQTVKITASYDARSSAGLVDLRLRGPNDCDFISAYDTRSRDPNNTDLVTQYLEHTAQNGGVYYITASLDQGRQVNYDLDIEIVDGPPCLDDDSEDNDDIASADVIDRANALLGQENALIGRRYCDLDEDFYSLNLEVGDKVRWVVKHDVAGGKDLDATIYLPDGSNPVSGTSTTDDEEVEYVATTAGVHTLRVYGKSPIRTTYRLLTYLTPNGSVEEIGPVDPDCPDPLENNDTRAEAVSIAPGVYELLVCGQPLDNDWFTIRLNPGETLTVRADFLHSEGNIDLFLFDDSTSNQAVVRSQTSADFEEVTYTTVREQDLFIKLNTYSGVSSNTYTLTTTVTPAPACADDALEQNDVAASASALVAPGLYDNLAKCEDDDDWYSFEVTENQKAEVYLNFKGNGTELDIELYDDVAGTTLVDSAVGTAADSETLVFTAPDDAATAPSDPQTVYTYWVKVTTKQRARLGNYDLLLFRDLDGNGTFGAGEGNADRVCPDRFENNDSSLSATPLPAGSESDLRLCWEGGLRNDEDHYTIFVPSGATITATATFAHAQGDIQMDLYREGTGAPVDTGRTGDDNEVVSDTNMTGSGKTYRVRLYGVGRFTTTYDFQFELVFSSVCPEDAAGSPSLADADTGAATPVGSYPNLALCEGTEDFFKISLLPNEQLVAHIELNNKFGNIDMQLLDDSGAIVATSASDGNIETITFNADLTGGDYFLRVYSRNDVFIRNFYDLWFSAGASVPAEPYCPDPYERNDTQEGAFALPVSTKKLYDDMISCGQDPDWYTLSGLTSGASTLRVFFDQQPGVDLDVTIIDDLGVTVATGNSSTNDEILTFTASSARTYFVSVENIALNPIESPYLFQVQRDNASCVDDSYEPNNNGFQPAPLPGPGRYALANCGGQQMLSSNDFFSVAAVNAGPLTIRIIHDASLVNLGLTVNGSMAPASVDGRIEFTVPAVTAGQVVNFNLVNLTGEGGYFVEILN